MKIKNLYKRILKAQKYNMIERVRVLAHAKATGERHAFNEVISVRT